MIAFFEYEEIVWETDNVDGKHCFKIKGKEYWIPYRMVKIMKSTKSIEVPISVAIEWNLPKDDSNNM